MNSLIQPLRHDALSIFQAGIAAADPYQAVIDSLNVSGDNIEIALDLNDPTKKRIGNWTNIQLIAFGKAACSMINAAQQIIPKHKLANQPLAITNYENVTAIKGCEVIGAAHPLPDMAGLKAAKYITKILHHTHADELVLFLISGGGSALIPYPSEGITLADKIITTDLLLASGANINQINCVRKHLSQIKGGQMAKLATPADVHSLILSDVIDDDLSSIASGSTVPDNTTFADAISILKAYNIFKKTPGSIQALLKKGVKNEIADTPKSNDPCFEKTFQTLIGSNSISLTAMKKAAKEHDYDVTIFSQHLSGEAQDAAKDFFYYAKGLTDKNLTKKTAILSGGETTVTLTGKGQGGRNQEMALAFAFISAQHPLKGKWTFLSGGTDGRDGSTDAAGGIVDSQTVSRLGDAGLSARMMLKNNDSHTALKKSNDLVMTGATGTNVADLQILLIQPDI